MLEKKPESEAGAAEAAPHYHGHRERLRARFREPAPRRCPIMSYSNCCCFA
jgi:hypothetical protein